MADRLPPPSDHWATFPLPEIPDTPGGMPVNPDLAGADFDRRRQASSLPEPPPEASASLDRGIWQYRGMTLLSDDHDGIPLGELAEFVAWVRKHMPDAAIRVHRNGLRAVQMEGSNNGPYLDWRDWD